MPIEPIKNKSANQAGEQKDKQPLEQDRSIINNEIDDDFGNSYLLGRQVAHEYYSPGVQSLIKLGIDPQQFREAQKDIGRPKSERQKQQEQFTDELLRYGGSLEEAAAGGKVEPTEIAALQDPWIDPVSAFAGGFGGVGTLSVKAGMKLMPSLGRAVTAGAISAITEYPIGIATEKVEEVAPGAALPFNVLTGFISGATLENAIERSVIKFAGSGIETPRIKQLAASVYEELLSGNPQTDLGKKVQQHLNEAWQFVANESGEIKFGKKDIPDFKNTNEAVAFGEQATPKQIKKLEKLEAEARAKEAEYKAAKDFSDARSQNVYMAQLYREAQEAAKGEHPSQKNVFVEVVRGNKSEISKQVSGIPESQQKIGEAAEAVIEAKPDIERKYAGNINLTKLIQEPDDIRKIIAGTADQFQSELQTARRGKVSWEQTEKDAQKYGLKDLLGRRIGQAYNDAEVENARTLLVSSSENLKVLRDKMLTKTATDADKADFLNAFNMHYAIEMQIAGAAAEAGRALRAFGKMAGLKTLKTRQIQKMLSQGKGKYSEKLKTRQIQETLSQGKGKYNADQIAEMLVGMESVHQINKTVEGLHRATTWDMALEAWINGLLSGPQTHVVNTVSNILTALWQVPERTIAAGISKTLRTPGGVKIGEARYQAWGFVEGAKDGFKTAVKVLRSGEPLDPIDKIEVRQRRAITAENIRTLPVIKKMAPNILQQGGMAAHAIDLMGEGVRLPGRLLGAEDEFFKSVGYRMELQARAYRSAIDKGLTDNDAIANHMAKILENPAENAPDIHLAAIDAARYQTFTKELGDTGKNFQRAFNSTPILRFVVPFMRTPTNIIKFAGERSPVAWISKNVRAEIAAGGARRDIALAKMGMGTMAMTMIGTFAAQGLITGGGPSNPREMATLRTSGWQPYSIKVGDKFISYSRVEPMGMLFGLAADFVNISGLADENMQPEIDELAGAILASMSKNVTSKTWLEGVSGAIEAFEDPDRYMERFLQGYAKTIIPTGVAQIERTIDPEIEAIYGMMDAIKSRIPGLSASLPNRRNIWGDEISTAINETRGWAEVVSSAFNPFYISRDKTTPIDEELVRLDSPISKPKRLQTFNGISYQLDPQQYDDFIVFMNETKLQTTGKNLKDSLNDLVIKDQYYKNSHDDEKSILIRRYFNNAKKEARMKILEKYPLINQIVETIRTQESVGR